MVKPEAATTPSAAVVTAVASRSNLPARGSR